MKILVIEKEVFWHVQIREAMLEKSVTVVSARTKELARRMLVQNPDIEVIAITDHIASGNCNGATEPDTLGLVKEIRKTFTGKMIACSSNCNFENMLISAGCDLQVFKSHLSEKLLEVLGFPVEASAS